MGFTARLLVVLAAARRRGGGAGGRRRPRPADRAERRGLPRRQARGLRAGGGAAARPRRRGGAASLALHACSTRRTPTPSRCPAADLRDPRHAGAGGDEAELAAILGHEIGHAVAGDGTVPLGATAAGGRRSSPPTDGACSIWTAAGYDPGAQVDFLETLLASQSLEVAASARRPGARADDARRRSSGAGRPAAAARRRRPGRRGRPGAAQPRRLSRGDRRHGLGRRAGAGLRARAELPAPGRCASPSRRRPAMRWPTGRTRWWRPGRGGAMLLLDSLPDPGGSPEAYLLGAGCRRSAATSGSVRVEGLRRTDDRGLPAAQAQADAGVAGRARGSRS